MQDLLTEVDHWLAQGKEVALATVVSTWGSAPRRPGAKMAVSGKGDIAGSVSGGCVEGAVVEAAQTVLETGKPQLLHFGVSDDTAWNVGLACGGEIEVFVERLQSERYQIIRGWLLEGRSGAVVTLLAPEVRAGQQLMVDDQGQAQGNLAEAQTAALEKAQEALVKGHSEKQSLSPTVQAFIEAVLPRPTLIMVGAVHISQSLAQLAGVLGYRTVVVDPRRAFGTFERFPQVDQLIQAWPAAAFEQLVLAANTAVATLTHDPKIDDPALKAALNSSAFYVGALGSRRTHGKRRQRLLEAGLSPKQLDRIHAPIGLDIHAQTPEEIALAILAEIVATRRQPH